MKILILDNYKITKFNLPEKIEGTYLIPYRCHDCQTDNTITIEAEENHWKLKSNGSVDVLNGDILRESAQLDNYQYYNLKINSTSEKITLYCAPIIENNIYNLSISNLTNITIGSSDNCNICYSNLLVKDTHATITYEDNNWYITSNQDCLTYLNDIKINKAKLQLGDVIFINGLKIIWMNKYIKINNPNNIVLVKGLSVFQPLVSNKEEIKPVPDEELNKSLYKEDEYFYHTPRLRSIVIEEKVQIDPPPQMGNEDNTPAILTIGSSITMAASSLMTGYTVVYGLASGTKTLIASIPQIVICFALIFGCIIIPRVSNHYKKKKRKEKENLRQTKYKQYLNEKEEQINFIMKQQKQILLENNLTSDECEEIITKNKDNIWFREINDDDFLNIRLGLGSCPVKIKLQAPEKHFTLEEDNLFNLVLDVVNKTRTLDDIPVTMSLVQKNISAFICDCKFEREFINSILIQLATLQASSDLKIVVLTDEDKKERWEFAKYLPHCFSDDKSMRFFATNMDEAKEVSNYLEKEFKNRQESLKNAGSEEYKDIKKDKEYKNFLPYYIVINDNYKMAKNISIINYITKEELNCGFSLIIIEKSMKNLPNRCETFVNVLDIDSCIFEKELNNQQQKRFIAEYSKDLNMTELAVKLSNIPISVIDEEYVLPKSISFLEMYGVSKIEQLNILNRWKQNNPIQNLSAPVGVHTNGELFKLDLHEKFSGPHGLIAGSTGSGKSEFIITYILSMAINYHPDEVQFVLIDYKGGGLAGAFENRETKIRLPHLAGTITNLDTAEMNRTLVSIDSELKRRQKLFNEVRDKLGESTIDIYKYQKYYREGLINIPLSHLFIISDEFAELKTQQPEFMNQLISTARIGRSLGVHLILATQKPMGIVNDQIWSNTKFRVCLKVQDRADSVGVLKRPEAASLKEVGRFYLQVGYDDYFDIGQSAWSGARYIPSDKIIKKIDNSINFINNYGFITKSVDDDIKIDYKLNLGDQLTNIVKYLDDISKKENIRVKKLWLDNIPEIIYVNDLKQKYNYQIKPYTINPIIGEYDNPKEQYQGLLTLDLTANNTLIYGQSGSGKETLLTTIIYESIVDHTPDEVNFYLLDFGSETLKIFNKIPHIGDIVLMEDSDKIIELISMLSKEMEYRKDLFSDYAGNYVNYIKSSNQKLPLIIIVINSYEVFSENYSKASELIQTLMRDGSKYGIVFIVTTSVTNSIRSRTAQNFTNKISLQLSNDNDYRLLINAPKNLLPTKFFGRGLTIIDSKVFEFQTAIISQKEQINETIKSFKQQAISKYKIGAKKIPIVPKFVTFDLIENKITDLQNVPIGISIKNKEIYYYNFIQKHINLILANNIYDKGKFLKAIIKSFNKIGNINIKIVDLANMFKVDRENNNYFNKSFDIALNTISKELSVESNISSKNIYIFIGIGLYKKKLNQNSINLLDNIMMNVDKYTNSYFIVFDSYPSYKNIQADPWIKNKIDSSNGIWLGEGAGAQIAIQINDFTMEDRKLNFPYMGVVVQKEFKEIVKCAIDDKGDNHEQ